MLDINALSSVYSVREMAAPDADMILALCRTNTFYYECCGRMTTRGEILSDLTVLPPGITPDRKHYLGFFRSGVLAAVLDLIDGYPEPEIAFFGFFMVDASLQGRGVGTALISELADALGLMGFSEIRLGIMGESPQAVRFWEKNRFSVLRTIERDDGTVLYAARVLNN